LIALRWGDVREDRILVQRSVRVGRVKVTKTASGDRTVALLPAARAAISLLTRGEPDTAVFIKPATGEPFWEDRSLARDFRLDCEDAGVRYRGPNQCRHTYATWALSSGENPAWIARQMGHSDTLMLFKTYGKWMPQIDPMAGSKMVLAARSEAHS
jgi:integrase